MVVCGGGEQIMPDVECFIIIKKVRQINHHIFPVRNTE
jgi:hypothetical protein